jgi:hypothetical protein
MATKTDVKPKTAQEWMEARGQDYADDDKAQRLIDEDERLLTPMTFAHVRFHQLYDRSMLAFAASRWHNLWPGQGNRFRLSVDDRSEQKWLIKRDNEIAMALKDRAFAWGSFSGAEFVMPRMKTGAGPNDEWLVLADDDDMKRRAGQWDAEDGVRDALDELEGMIAVIAYVLSGQPAAYKRWRKVLNRLCGTGEPTGDLLALLSLTDDDDEIWDAD